MNVKQLRKALEGYDEDLEVKVRLSVDSGIMEDPGGLEISDLDGQYLATDHVGGVFVQYGTLVIVGDLLEDDL